MLITGILCERMRYSLSISHNQTKACQCLYLACYNICKTSNKVINKCKYIKSMDVIELGIVDYTISVATSQIRPQTNRSVTEQKMLYTHYSKVPCNTPILLRFVVHLWLATWMCIYVIITILYVCGKRKPVKGSFDYMYIMYVVHNYICTKTQ